MTKIKIIPYTKGEEIFNFVSHVAAGGLCALGTALLIVFAALSGDSLSVVSCAVYGASMIILYTMSGLYHILKGETVKRFFRIMDHNTIFLLIAGTYTPYSLIALRGTVGWVLFGIIWGMAAIGITLNSIDLEKYKKLSMVCYIVMGWAVIFTIKPLIEAVTSFALIFLVAGGVAYTVGIFFYAKKRIKYFHSVWHLFVVLGTALKFASVLNIVINSI